MAAGSVIIDLLMRTSGFVTDTQRAAKSLKQLQKEAEATSRAFKASFTGNLLADFAGQFGRAIARLPGQVIDGLDALNDLSDATGSTVENLSALEHVAKLNGQTLDDVGGIVVKFNNALKEADGKNGVSQALKAIGLDAKELQKLDPAEALRLTARALATFADDGNKARLVQELFGKSVKEAGQFLKDLAEQGQLNATANKEQTKAAEDFNKAIFQVQTSISDAARAIAGEWLPAINDMIRSFLRARETGESFIDAVFGNTAQTKLSGQATRISQDIERATDSIVRMQTELDRKGGNDPQLAVRLEKARDRLRGLQAQAQITTGELKKLADTRDPFSDPADYSNEGRGRPPRSVGAITKAGPKGTDPFDALIKSAREMLAVSQAALEAEDNLTEAQKAGIKIGTDIANGTLKLTDARIREIDATLKLADAAQKDLETKKLSAKLTDEAIQENEQFVQSQRDRLASFQSEAKAMREELAVFGLSREAIEARAIAFERDKAARLDAQAQQAENAYLDDNAKLYREQAKAIRESADARQQILAQQTQLQNDPLTGASKALDDYLAHISKAGDATREAVGNALHSLEDLTVDALMGGNIKSAAKSLVNQIISEFYRLQIVRPLLNSIFGAGGGLSGILAMFNSGGGTGIGGAEGSTFMPNYAVGTNYVPKDGPAFLHQGEAVVPKAHNQRGGDGGTIVEVNNYSGASVREETSQRGDKKLVRLIIGEVAADSRRGGPTRQATREAVGPRARRG